MLIAEYPNAVENLQAFLIDYHRYDKARSYLGAVLYNLGLTYRRRNDNANALHYYREALACYSEKGLTFMTGKTHQNLAWLYCLEGDDESAESEVRLAESFADVCGAEFKTEQLLCRAFVLFLRKQIVTALRLTAEVLQTGRPGTTDGHRAEACWLTGRCSLAMYDVRAAQSFAEYAEEYAIRHKDPEATSLASSLKTEVARRLQESDEAAK